jgi:hypothetical protein
MVILGLPEHSRYDFTRAGVDRYVMIAEIEEWRTYSALNLFTRIDNQVIKRIGFE